MCAKWCCVNGVDPRNEHRHRTHWCVCVCVCVCVCFASVCAAGAVTVGMTLLQALWTDCIEVSAHEQNRAVNQRAVRCR